jgi:two-component system sensor histidine kinase PilS (NtrC family)
MTDTLFKKIRLFIIIRLFVVTLLLGSFYILKIGYDRIYNNTAFSYLIASLYLLTIIYALALEWIKKANWLTVFAYIQIIIDVIAETLIVFLTGGIASWFSFLYPLSILSSTILLTSRACYIIATISSVLYGLLLILQFYKIIPLSTDIPFTPKEYFYNTFANITAFYLIAFLSGYLSERLYRTTKTLEEKETVLSDLKVLSRDIIESMPGGVFTTDLDRRIITFNRSAQKITGYKPEEVMGRRPEDIFPFLKGVGFQRRTEGEIVRNGRRIIIGIGFSKLRNSFGEEVGLIGTFQDLTELKAMEAEIKKKEKWALIGELSASVAHELRNPLASLKASVEMLLNENMPGYHARRLATIALSEMERLNNIVTDFLIYARPPKLNSTTFDLHRVLRDVVALLQSTEREDKSVKIISRLDDELTITGDSRQLQQVFWNLGTNAIDAVSEGGVIEIYTNKRDATVEVVFRDNGVGLNSNDMERIFYPFFTTKEKGTGLGLSIAQRIIEEHGGRIAVTSEGKGKGATFTVILPVNPPSYRA